MKKSNLSKMSKWFERLKGMFLLALFFSALYGITLLSKIIAQGILLMDFETLSLIIQLLLFAFTMLYVLPELKKGE